MKNRHAWVAKFIDSEGEVPFVIGVYTSKKKAFERIQEDLQQHVEAFFERPNDDRVYVYQTYEGYQIRRREKLPTMDEVLRFVWVEDWVLQ